MLPAPLRRIRSVLGARLHRLESGLEQVGALRQEVKGLRAAVSDLQEGQRKQLALSRVAYDDLGGLRQQLIALRNSDAYAATFENRRPLVSVPIATFNSADSLIDRAIASVRAQAYDRWEIVVVGDGCTDQTADRMEQLGDPRIRFLNLPFRTVYPDDPHHRWQVSGASPWNRAVELCRGEWIAPLDDDDELLPNHMQTLLDLALESRAEYVYGKLELAEPGAQPYIYSFPPEMGNIGMQQALYLRGLSFFECDIHSWAIDEPTDWNVIRRMRDAGVHMRATEEPVARYHVSTQKRAHEM